MEELTSVSLEECLQAHSFSAALRCSSRYSSTCWCRVCQTHTQSQNSQTHSVSLTVRPRKLLDSSLTGVAFSI